MKNKILNKFRGSMRAVDIAYIALCVALTAVCAWISVPATVPFTLQTFAVFFSLGILGGKKGSIAVFVYVALGAVGVPVFHSFTGGFSVLLNVTGGYIVGFIFSALSYWLITGIFGKKMYIKIAAIIIGLIICYAFGTAWFIYIYGRQVAKITLGAALTMCVVPYIIPDALKLCLAFFLSERLAKFVNPKINENVK